MTRVNRDALNESQVVETRKIIYRAWAIRKQKGFQELDKESG